MATGMIFASHLSRITQTIRFSLPNFHPDQKFPLNHHRDYRQLANAPLLGFTKVTKGPPWFFSRRQLQCPGQLPVAFLLNAEGDLLLSAPCSSRNRPGA